MAARFGKSPAWTGASGPDRDVALSARARLARNLAGVPFPHRASEEELRQVAQSVRRAVRAQADALPALEPILVRGLDEEDRMALLASQRISPSLARSTGPERWALIDDAGDVSLFVNEEDHVRLQKIAAGSAVREASERALCYADALRQELDFATDARWGTLTSSLSNLGTGLRVSVLVHLPAMALRRKLGDELAVAYDLDTAVRGLHGEGTETWGDLYQISNRISYGRSERELTDRVIATAQHFILEERTSRDVLRIVHSGYIKTLCRTLRQRLLDAPTLSPAEALEILSGIRLAAVCEVAPGPSETVFARQVASLRSTEAMVGQRANIARAASMRDALRPFLDF